MSKKKVDGEVVLKKIFPLCIKEPPNTKGYHAKYMRGNRFLESEKKNGGGAAIRALELQAERLFNDLNKLFNKRII